MYQQPPPLKVLIHAKLRPVSSTGSASSISVQMWESKSKHSTDLSRSIESQLYPPATYILDPTDVQPNSALGVRMCEMTVQQSLEGVYLSIESIHVMVPSWLTVAPPISSKDPEIETRWAKNLGVEIGCFISHLSSNGLQLSTRLEIILFPVQNIGTINFFTGVDTVFQRKKYS